MVEIRDLLERAAFDASYDDLDGIEAEIRARLAPDPVAEKGELRSCHDYIEMSDAKDACKACGEVFAAHESDAHTLPTFGYDVAEIVWKIVKHDSLASSKIGHPSDKTTAKLKVAIESYAQAQAGEIVAKRTAEVRRSERVWAYKNMRDHGTDREWVEVAKRRLDAARTPLPAEEQQGDNPL